MIVPCGQCGECRQRRQDDVSARVYYEYLNCIKSGGFVFFQSYTHNEDTVPWCHGVRCFDPSDYRTFYHNLRNAFVKLGYKKIPVKNFWVSEFGGLTYRPHYHCLHFVYAQDVTPEQFARMTEVAWSFAGERSFQKCERFSFGFCDTNNPDPSRRHTPRSRVVDGFGALSYVSKYVCKDLDFIEVLTNQKNSSYDGLPLSDEEKKRMYPYTRQSNGIGECMKDMITVDELMDGRVSIPDAQVGNKVIALPQYIDRKVFYDYDPEDKCFRLNECGLDMKKVRREHNREYVKEQIIYFMSSFSALWTDYAERKLHMSSAAALQRCHEIIDDRQSDLVNYIIYYKDISSTYVADIDSATDLHRMGEAMIASSVRKPPKFNLSDYKDRDPSGYRSFMYEVYGRMHSRFRDFDEVIEILNLVNLGFCHEQQLLYLSRQEEKSKAKYRHSLYH